MKHVVFDIETVGAEFDSLGPEEQKYIQRRRLKDRLGLYPLFAEVVTVALVDVESGQGQVFFQAPGQEVAPFEEEGLRYETCDEPGLLRRFWDCVREYDQYITFNGRSFDGPFLLARSAKHRVHPSVDLMGERKVGPGEQGQVDLMDRLSFFGANRDFFNLDMWCRFLGVNSPKGDGITGADVKDLYAAGRHLDIARYCAGDVRATAELFRLWEEYFQGG